MDSTPMYRALAVLMLLPAGVVADAVCQNCFEKYRSPGGADADSVGLYRMENCPACQKPDCKNAAKHAAELKKEYLDYRWSYEEFRKKLNDQRARSETVPASAQKQLDDMKARLTALEEHYAALEAKCPKEVPGTNIWDGTSYSAPVGDPPANSPPSATQTSRAAEQAAHTYDQMSADEQQEFDTIDAFLGSKLGEYNPPDRGFNGSRYSSTKTSRDVADAYRSHSQPATQGNGSKPDSKIDLKKPVKPKFQEFKVPKDGPAHVRNNGIALRARTEGHAYTIAYLDARSRYHRAQAVGDADAARMHAHDAVVFAYQAQGYARWAADHRHLADGAHQKLLDTQLAAAANQGWTISKLLEQFQTEVRKSGLPKHVADALAAAGASDADREATQSRLLALTPAAVETFLKERRSRVAGKAQVPDKAILDLQLTLARDAHHRTGMR